MIRARTAIILIIVGLSMGFLVSIPGSGDKPCVRTISYSQGTEPAAIQSWLKKGCRIQLVP